MKYFLIPLVYLINGLVTYFKMAFLIERSPLPGAYLVFMIVFVLIWLAFGTRPGYRTLERIVLWLHNLVHGILILTLPIGMVFALTGSYTLAFQVFFLVYFSSALVIFINLYYLKKRRHS